MGLKGKFRLIKVNAYIDNLKYKNFFFMIKLREYCFLSAFY